MKVGLISLVHEELHEPPYGHPENSSRMAIPLQVLMESTLKEGIEVLTPDAVEAADIIYQVHNKNYIERVREISEAGGGYLDGDTYVTEGTYEAAWMTASAAVWSTGELLEGRWKRIFLAGRPPGHHAERNYGMGFCIINNTAVAAEAAIKKHGLKRVAIIDWDVHHGNGTQRTFYERDDVLFISLHRYPFYPGSGATAEKGESRGENYTLNIPLPAGSDDEIYIGEFKKRAIPALMRYEPEFIIITAGFDAHEEDPLGGMRMTEQGFGEMTRLLVEVAEQFCEGRILSLFEGGYSPQGNSLSLNQHIRELQRD